MHALALTAAAVLLVAVGNAGAVRPALGFEPPDQVDIRFLHDAASAGMLEVELGKLASHRSDNAAVRKFSDRMIADHSKAHSKLLTVAKKVGVAVPQELDKKHQDALAKLKGFQGKDFDREYMKAMVKDHKDAVALFEKGANAQNQDIRAFAAEVLPTIEDHLKMARDAAAKAGVAPTEEKR